MATARGVSRRYLLQTFGVGSFENNFGPCGSWPRVVRMMLAPRISAPPAQA